VEDLPMKKISCLILLLIVSGLFILPAMTKAQTDAWIAILGEKTLQVKLDKLEEYYKTYGDTDERNATYMYLNLADTSYQLQQFEKTIQYGEKALLYKDIEAQNKLRIYLFLANSYNLTKKDLDKAYSYADLVIELAKSLRLENQSNSNTIDISFVAPALRIQVQLLLSKSQDEKNTSDAFAKALESFNLDKSEKSSNFVLFLSDRMLKLQKVEEAIRGIETINQNKPNVDYYKKLGMWYARLKNIDKAIENLKASYEMKKNAKVAYDLGVLLNKTDIDSAMNYLAEANLLNEEKYSEEALKLLQQLVFYVKTKGQPQEEQEKIYNDILAAAKTRLGITLP
jgi:tetratricopeptide (TPR) repeat protein